MAMACHWLLHHSILPFCRSVYGLRECFVGSRGPGRKLRLRRSKVHYWYDSTGLSMNAYCHAAIRVFPVDGRKLLKSTSTNSANQGKHSMKTDSLNNRVMFIDGTSILYRSYYKLLARLHHGHLEHADGNGDWVLTIFTALSMLLNVLEFVPSHVVVVFDHDGERYVPVDVSNYGG